MGYRLSIIGQVGHMKNDSWPSSQIVSGIKWLQWGTRSIRIDNTHDFGYQFIFEVIMSTDRLTPRLIRSAKVLFQGLLDGTKMGFCGESGSFSC